VLPIVAAAVAVLAPVLARCAAGVERLYRGGLLCLLVEAFGTRAAELAICAAAAAEFVSAPKGADARASAGAACVQGHSACAGIHNGHGRRVAEVGHGAAGLILGAFSLDGAAACGAVSEDDAVAGVLAAEIRETDVATCKVYKRS